ncbi:MAG TPA: hypothetical protein VF070_14010 [Streptosporangiaceae bacterium]
MSEHLGKLALRQRAPGLHAELAGGHRRVISGIGFGTASPPVLADFLMPVVGGTTRRGGTPLPVRR